MWVTWQKEGKGDNLLLVTKILLYIMEQKEHIFCYTVCCEVFQRNYIAESDISVEDLLADT